jgi:hypothetical protein
MAWTRHRYGAAALEAAPADPLFESLFRPIDELLASGGDSRLTLSVPARENSYGCTPFPRGGLVDFASSTASSISREAYGRAQTARDALLAHALRDGAEAACEAASEAARTALLTQLKLEESGAEVVFAPSGTDAQVHALFLAGALLRRPLTAIIVGSDQTGSGTAHTCKGQHFSQTTSRGWAVEKGAVIPGLADSLASIEITFCKPDGCFRSLAEMDAAVTEAVEIATGQGRGVLLQAMDASKFGWKAPSDECLSEIARRWPDQVQIVMDACQLRLSRTRLKDLLAQNCCVLVTGSKFFTGPAFSGALLVPRTVSQRIAALDGAASGLSGYSSRHDWPRRWPGLRAHFPEDLNLGQWLRWEAALEEMRRYYAVPKGFRDGFAKAFAARLTERIAQSSCLSLLPTGLAPEPGRIPTVFAVALADDGVGVSPKACAEIYRAMRRDLSALLPAASGVDLVLPCQLGQPVSLPSRGTAVLRISASARMIRDCWSDDAETTGRNVARLLESLTGAVAKLDHLARHASQLAGA